MKKKLFCLFLCLLLSVFAVAQAATLSYSLPEKLLNQLKIGSGLKGEFRLSAEGDMAKTPLFDAVTDADFALRGMSSGEDLHYYVYQTDETERQFAVSELLRKDGVFYFRSDMVQGTILALPTGESMLDSFLPKQGENPTLASAVIRLLTQPAEERKQKWGSVLSRYQDGLEMWLANFTVKADVVSQEEGNSALDFSYAIPVEELKRRIVTLVTEAAEDTEATALLDDLLTPEQKNLYVNAGLKPYYEAALDALQLTGEVRLSKRVSTLGAMLSSSLQLPLDEEKTGYNTLTFESRDGVTLLTVSGAEKTLLVGFPEETQDEDPTQISRSLWLYRLGDEALLDGLVPGDVALRLDLQKKTREYTDEEERSHLEEQYRVTVSRDETYLPEGYDAAELAEMEEITAELTLHYYSKYAQNIPTHLEVIASARQGENSLTFAGAFKTASPWLFMPFEVVDPVTVIPGEEKTFSDYWTDWLSNAPSLIHHSEGTTEETETIEETETTEQTETTAEAASVPSDETETPVPAGEPAAETGDTAEP